ncbi:TetR/AcrR family transcriptional regulator [Mycobacteroides immunogenum]|uniref:TetR family transcriptional regulator n=1 Tax=Mycobacteroides immunogenum TaxID=83262 RepID=A0A0N1CLF1_9MYCO|nr:TetR/AcrR family transcriptional regulator [Mycobacteroides immunogenum]AMT73029.1 TetR family transcriptional regulator [Mycobacteroides immunogenum]ANO06187.1 TetR family transcriptional regulator [Mycobacteroides immunogenum]KIU41830.1 TetR family transcriptional regulator [Mycobacteroides immunogenum]KPG11646.1 TetR family transcriptional regulator [Mycobacteroides immunogenum]KPG11866.1 TetR family transcriptional regulator [Mycobacteroides immunogenum]
MAGGTKRLPRAVREQQMLDAAVQEFALNGFRDTSMDAIAAAAKISKPMLYLYYGSKEDLFVACLRRELGRFVEAVRGDIDLTQSPRDVLSTTVVSFLNYVDTHRASWIVIYGQATSTQLFAKQVREGRDRIIELVARLIKAASPEIDPDTDYDAMAVALVGGGEAVASRVATGDIKVESAKDTLLNLGWRGLRGRPRDEPVAKRA